MKLQSHWIFLLVLGIALLAPRQLPAGTTGKIVGQVVDGETGDPLPGANIQIEGTSLGAATDVDGQFLIINVPPGTYTVVASMIGYQTVKKSQVRVTSDFTTRLRFVLHPTTLELGETVEVVAERPLVRRDQTASLAEFSGEEIRQLPVETFQEVLSLQAGVTVDPAGGLHIRGGRSSEITYIVDGIPITDEYSGLPTVAVENNVIEELRLVSGAFNAEYGRAMSGVVNIVTREGGPHWQLDGRAYIGDYLSAHRTIFMNIGAINPLAIQNVEFNIGGPLPLGFRLFVAVRHYYNEGWLYGRRDFNIADSTNLNSEDPADWFIRQTGDSAYIPMNDFLRRSVNAKITRRFGNVKLTYNLLWNRANYEEYFHEFKFTPEGNYQQFQEGQVHYLQLNLPLAATAFANVRAGFKENRYRYSVFENPLDPRYVDPVRLNIPAYRFFTGGTGMYYLKRRTRSYTGNATLTWQANDVHQFKAGVEITLHELYLRDFFIRPARDANGFQIRPFQPEIPPITDLGSSEYWRRPREVSIFLQDKIELQSVVFNAGVRLDYFDPNTTYPADPTDPAGSARYRVPAKSQISPRLGIAYPVTATGILHFSYGKFFQMPPFRYLYTNPQFHIAPGVLRSIVGNADLQPQQTAIYELGLQQQLGSHMALDVSLYVKDIRNLLGQEFFRLRNDVSSKYVRYTNRDYARVHGVSLFLEKRYANGWGATINYTYQVARGNASDPNALFYDLLANPPREPVRRLVYLDWDQRHTLNGTFTVGDNRHWYVSAIASFGSGLPYTPTYQNQRTAFENSARKPATFNIDLRASYFFTIGNRRFTIFAQVYNLMDRLNELRVYGDTGRAGYTLEGQFVGNTGLYSKDEFFNRPDFYSEPRRVLLGIEIR